MKKEYRSFVLLGVVLLITGLLVALFFYLTRDKETHETSEFTAKDRAAIATLAKEFSQEAGTFGAKKPATMDSFLKYHIDVLNSVPAVVKTREVTNGTLQEKFKFNVSQYIENKPPSYTINDLDVMEASQQIVGYTAQSINAEVPKEFFSDNGEDKVNVSVTMRSHKFNLTYVALPEQDGSESPYKGFNWVEFEGESPLTFSLEFTKKNGEWRVSDVSQISEPGLLSFDTEPNYMQLQEVQRYNVDYPQLSQYSDLKDCLTRGENCRVNGEKTPVTPDPQEKKKLEKEAENRPWKSQ